MKLITTSWDDGNIADMKLADLLDKYNLKGTFYIPRSNPEHSVMDERKIIELSQRFEIGGHTLNHVRIKLISEQLFETEIKGCYNWLAELLHKPPVSFCFPGGVLNKSAIDYTLKTGFKIIRTTELLNPGYVVNKVIPTTLQIYEHSSVTYIKHLVRRLNFNTLALYLRSHGISDLIKLLKFYLQNLEMKGGCLHIWGHSWEIEKYELWSTLEDIFRHLSEYTGAEYIENQDIITYKKQKL